MAQLKRWQTRERLQIIYPEFRLAVAIIRRAQLDASRGDKAAQEFFETAWYETLMDAARLLSGVGLPVGAVPEGVEV